MNQQLHNETKIFVTGIYGSGKTTYAKEYSKISDLKYVDFDMYFNYASTLSALKRESDEHFLNVLSNYYITDAIPWDPATGSSSRFIKFAKEDSKVLIVCCLCSDKEEWARRIVECKSLEISEERFKHYAGFYKDILPCYFENNLKYYDTFTNEYLDKEKMYERIAWINGYC